MNESNASSEVERYVKYCQKVLIHSEMFYLYIARCQDNSLYIGSTGLLPLQRIERHNAGTGAKWFIQHGPGKMVHTEEYPTLLEARRREAQIKRWSRQKKERLIAGLKP